MVGFGKRRGRSGRVAPQKVPLGSKQTVLALLRDRQTVLRLALCAAGIVGTVLAGDDGDRARPVDVAVAAAAIRACQDVEASRLHARRGSTGGSAWHAAGLREAHGRARGQ